MSIEALEGVTDKELFDDAHSDEPIAEEAVSEVAKAEPVEQTNEQPRDEAGRFATTAEVQPTPVATETPVPPVDDNAAMVPSWRVREINEEKRTLADKLAALEAERSQWQQRPAPQPPVKVEKPDPLLDPEGYENYLEQRFEEKLLNNQREHSLANAHKTYKAEFEEAYAAAQRFLDPILKMKMQSSRDPGETLIEWHREQKTRAEVGTDLNAFRQRERAALLKDPVFLAEATKAASQFAQQNAGNGRQPSPVSLPPSLTRATNASAELNADDDDTSNDGLWRHANA